MSYQNHYGLEYVLNCSPEEVERKIQELQKPNRIQVTDTDKMVLQGQLAARMKVRKQREDERRKEYHK